MTDTNVPIELVSKIYNIAGRENGKKIVDLLREHGLEIITKIDGINISLPTIEIKSFPSAQGRPGILNALRKHEFICTINGKSLGPMIQKIELDAFDYNDADIFNVKITLNVIADSKGDNKCVILD